MYTSKVNRPKPYHQSWQLNSLGIPPGKNKSCTAMCRSIYEYVGIYWKNVTIYISNMYLLVPKELLPQGCARGVCKEGV